MLFKAISPLIELVIIIQSFFENNVIITTKIITIYTRNFFLYKYPI